MEGYLDRSVDFVYSVIYIYYTILFFSSYIDLFIFYKFKEIRHYLNITEMITSLIITYCDWIISFTQYIKKKVSYDVNYKKLVNMTSQEDAIMWLDKTYKDYHIIKASRKERHILYTLLKGRKSTYNIYSIGKEDKNTNKQIIIKKC